jgi:hypothetical protein
VNRSQYLRKAPGIRPLTPVRLDDPPDDWKCTWVYVPVSCLPGENGTGYWELKYINAACDQHARLPVA